MSEYIELMERLKKRIAETTKEIEIPEEVKMLLEIVCMGLYALDKASKDLTMCNNIEVWEEIVGKYGEYLLTAIEIARESQGQPTEWIPQNKGKN